MEQDRHDKSLVSVIIPVYNAETTLERCVESVMSQDYGNLEIIIVDDGSSDKSVQMCDSFAARDSRIKVFHQENKGVSAARNLAVEKATGYWIAFCDSDDYADRNWISSMMSVSGRAGLVVGGYKIYRYDVFPDPDPRSECFREEEYMTDAEAVIEKLLNARLLQFVWNKLFRKDVILSAGLAFNEKFSVFEDEYFVLEYLMHIDDVLVIPECTYNYYIPHDFMKRYDAGIDPFQEVVELIYRILAHVPGRVRLPAVIYWYKVALGRYAAGHTYEDTRGRIEFARKLADNFHKGIFNHLTLRILPSRMIYNILRKRES